MAKNYLGRSKRTPPNDKRKRQAPRRRRKSHPASPPRIPIRSRAQDPPRRDRRQRKDKDLHQRIRACRPRRAKPPCRHSDRQNHFHRLSKARSICLPQRSALAPTSRPRQKAEPTWQV